ncbi:MAG: hypothetical protein ACOVMQ_04690 [Cyclobacteriaceae bacterium]
MNELDAIVSHYLARIGRGEVEFDQIRNELESKNVNSETITSIIRKIDSELIHHTTNQYRLATLKNLAVFGGVLTAIGLITIIISVLGLLNTTSRQIIVFAYGPFFSGIFILLAAIRKKNQKGNIFSKEKSLFDKIGKRMN